MTAHAIEGARVRLRDWRESDLPVLQAIRNDAALQAQVLAHARGSGVEQVREWLRRRRSERATRFYVIALRGDDAALGYLQFMGLEAPDLRAELGICLAHDAQGKGLGPEAIGLALAHLRVADSLRKCTLQVRADNERAIRCYRALGFDACGRWHRHFFFEEIWHDVVLMEWFAD